MGGENSIPKLCKGRTKEQCNDNTGDCKYIDGAKRKYCKRVNICKRSCNYPCTKVENNGINYCIPPDKKGNPQSLEDVKDIMSEFEADIETNESEQIDKIDEIEYNIQQDLNETHKSKNSEITKYEIDKNEDIVENNIKSDNTINKSLNVNENDNNYEKGSVSSVLYSKSTYDGNIGSCSIL